jgi:hypothetical protein
MSAEGYIAAEVVEGIGNVSVPEALVRPAGYHNIGPTDIVGRIYPLSMSFRWVISTAGQIQIRLRVKSNEAAIVLTGTDNKSFSIGSYQVWRP